VGLVDEDGVPAGVAPNYRSEFSAAEFQLMRGWWRGPVEFRLASLGEPREAFYPPGSFILRRNAL
jgi:hypothetical protein